MIGKAPAGLGRWMFKVLLVLAAVEAVVLASVEVFETVRRRCFWGQPPKEGFPREEQPGIELDPGGEHVKLYPG